MLLSALIRGVSLCNEQMWTQSPMTVQYFENLMSVEGSALIKTFCLGLEKIVEEGAEGT